MVMLSEAPAVRSGNGNERMKSSRSSETERDAIYLLSQRLLILMMIFLFLFPFPPFYYSDKINVLTAVPPLLFSMRELIQVSEVSPVYICLQHGDQLQRSFHAYDLQWTSLTHQ